MRMTIVLSAALLILLVGASQASAHEHTIAPSGEVIASGQNHPAFVNGVSCEWFAPAGGPTAPPIGPAWFGLETAHHGPDAGDPGRGDGCYQTTGSVLPGQDVQNPVIT